MRNTLLPLSLATLALVALTGCGVASTTPDATSTASPTPESTSSVSGGGFTNGDCTGLDVVIDQDETNAVLSGDCASVTISASSVFVTIENSDSVVSTGSKVDVVVSGAVDSVSMGGDQASFTGGDVGALEVPGSSINVTVNDLGSATLSGSNNFVVWSTGATSASDNGTSNTVVAP